MGFRSMFNMDEVDFNSKNSLHLYTDGSCFRNGSPNSACGWAYICIRQDSDQPMYIGHDGCVGATNNQMEMTAVLRGLQTSESAGLSNPITVYSDSKYVIETLKGNYSIKKNHELWAELFSEVRKFQNIQFVWVRGHANNQYNNQVDKLAVSESVKHDRK